LVVYKGAKNRFKGQEPLVDGSSTLHERWLLSSIFSPDQGEIREGEQVAKNFSAA
jgi:hypothetical protein